MDGFTVATGVRGKDQEVAIRLSTTWVAPILSGQAGRVVSMSSMECSVK
jgi:hypothetical protein